MRLLSLSLFCLSLVACGPSSAQHQAVDLSQTGQPRIAPVSETAQPLVRAARKRLEAQVVYDGRYIGLDYPGGDVPGNIGVCTDVLIRSLRKAYDFDLQKTVHVDMKAHFSAYPTNWGLKRTDKNIDHRRVPNLEVYFTRAGYDLPITKQQSDYAPGDIVSWRLDSNQGDGGLPHIGIVSERLGRTGNPLVIHNWGRGPEESDMLFDHSITGHFRLSGLSSAE